MNVALIVEGGQQSQGWMPPGSPIAWLALSSIQLVLCIPSCGR